MDWAIAAGLSNGATSGVVPGAADPEGAGEAEAASDAMAPADAEAAADPMAPADAEAAADAEGLADGFGVVIVLRFVGVISTATEKTSAPTSAAIPPAMYVARGARMPARKEPAIVGGSTNSWKRRFAMPFDPSG